VALCANKLALEHINARNERTRIAERMDPTLLKKFAINYGALFLLANVGIGSRIASWKFLSVSSLAWEHL
jgi:hypothetical protein